MKNTTLPSDRAADRIKKQAEAEIARTMERTALRNAMGVAFSTPEGKQVLRWLRAQCGHNEPILGANPVTGDLDPQRTLYSAMRLNLYLEIRKNLSFNILKEVEYG